ncbi:hypothetical protein DICVIV_09631 [Dictyocaulus viviparus]|uniref:Uncharacterized protein n=1 Tax=Dictyocaulus viviparus TaxID=29172 RepID=A0A0D8XI60_DICVI|nr:hypothetical protein DICVIV_09631 [Dictyocaulus viviparus]
MSLVFVIFVYLLLPSNVKIVDEWWKTALKGRNLVNLTPSQENTPMIPFLQVLLAIVNSSAIVSLCAGRKLELAVRFTAVVHHAAHVETDALSTTDFAKAKLLESENYDKFCSVIKV